MPIGSGLRRLMLVTDRLRAGGADWVQKVGAAMRGGVGIVQVREKDLPDVELCRFVRQIQQLAQPGVELLVNAGSSVAESLGVGLHLPANSPSTIAAGGRVRIVGRSVHSVAEAERALASGVSYLVLGTIYPTSCKPGHQGSGASLIRAVVEVAGAVPVYAIGGVTPERVSVCLEAGAYGVAVCSAILSADDPEHAAEAFTALLRAGS